MLCHIQIVQKELERLKKSAGLCRNVRGAIIESEGKGNDIDYSVYFKSAAVFEIYISNNIVVRTLY